MKALLKHLTSARRTAICVGIGTLAGIFFQFTRPGEAAANLSYDLLSIASASPATNSVVIIEMDDLAYRALKQDYDKLWDRGLHAELIDRLRTDGARLVVFDIFLRDAGTNGLEPGALAKAAEKNDKLATAIRQTPQLVIAADWAETTHGVVGESVLMPFEPFTEAASNRWGIAKIAFDGDLTVRRHYNGSSTDPSLPWAAAALLQAPITRKPENRLRERWLRYYREQPTFTRISYAVALGEPPGFFRDKIAFVGGRPLTLMNAQQADVFRTPRFNAKGEYTPGVFLQATALLNLIQEDALARVQAGPEFVFTVLWAALLGWWLSRLRRLHATFAALAASLLIVGCAFALQSFANVHWNWLVHAGLQPAAILTAALLLPLPPRLIAFISYRRADGGACALAILHALRSRGFDAHLDTHSLPSGRFPERIQELIRSVPNFVLICSPLVLKLPQPSVQPMEQGSPAGEADKDWVLEEVDYALRRNKNIIPIFLNTKASECPPSLRVLAEALKYTGPTYSQENFEANVDKLVGFLEEGALERSNELGKAETSPVHS